MRRRPAPFGRGGTGGGEEFSAKILARRGWSVWDILCYQKFVLRWVVQKMSMYRKDEAGGPCVVMRRAGLADAGAITALTRAAYAKWVPVIGREPLPMAVDYSVAVLAHRIDVLDDAGRLLGLVETVLQPDHVLVENLAVAEAAQRRGYGRAMLRHVEQIATEAGVGEVRLYTNQAFVQNVKFYQALGFRIDREQPFLGGVTTYMSKHLPVVADLNRTKNVENPE